MIVNAMSEDALYKEIEADMANVIAMSDRKEDKVRRLVIKGVHFPMYIHTLITTPRRNKWMVLWEARSKKYVGDNSLITFVCYQETTHGRYAYLPTFVDGRMLLLVFAPHLFSRFASRVGASEQGIHLIRRYFEQNPSYSFNFHRRMVGTSQCIDEVYAPTKEGIAMGVKTIHPRIYLFKTFITYSMTKGEQIETFAASERMRQELHEEHVSL